LLVPWGIDDDEASARRLEIAPSDVDGDALLALGLEAVEQQTEIDLLAVDGTVLRGERDCRALILGDASGIPQEAADQRRLAIIDRAAGEQLDQRPGLRSLDRPRSDRNLIPERCQMHQK
jgi:hypothetical protein